MNNKIEKKKSHNSTSAENLIFNGKKNSLLRSYQLSE